MTESALARTGRGTVLTEQTADSYLTAIESGLTLEQAAHVAGFHPSTVRRWRLRLAAAYDGDIDAALEADAPPDDGQEPSLAMLQAFFTAATRAEAHGVLSRLEEIRRAGSSDWRAHAWYLERRFPEQFGQRQKIEHAGSPDEPVLVRLTFDGVEDRSEPIDVEALEE